LGAEHGLGGCPDRGGFLDPLNDERRVATQGIVEERRGSRMKDPAGRPSGAADLLRCYPEAAAVWFWSRAGTRRPDRLRRRRCAAQLDAGAVARGRAEIEARIRSLTAGPECIRLPVNPIGVIDGRVFVERVDDFDVSGRHVELPVIGPFADRRGVAVVASSSCGDCTRPQLCWSRDLGRRLTSI
jgi:hypothetical protein